MCLELEGRIAFRPREDSMWAWAKQLTEYGVCEETASEELAAQPSLCWKGAGVAGRQLQPHPGPCRRPPPGANPLLLGTHVALFPPRYRTSPGLPDPSSH